MTTPRKLIQRLVDELDAAASNLYPDKYAPDIESALADANAYLSQPEPVVPPPSGWAYRYPTMDGSVIRFNHGQEVNGSKPLYAIPYWLGHRFAQPTLTPIPVSERLPREGDLDAGRRCWYFGESCDGMATAPTWAFARRGDDDTHWLPANALPLPAAPEEGG